MRNRKKLKVMSREELSEAEKKLFQELERRKTPSVSLEKKIINELINQGEIKKMNVMNNYVKLAASIAALILFFYGGMYFERTQPGEVVEVEPSKGYILLLHEDNSFSPGDPMAMFEEYSAWMENTMEKGVRITGQELKPGATFVSNQGRETSAEDALKRTTGYFILEAASYEEAVQVAVANPHVKYGGSVEVKPFMVR